MYPDSSSRSAQLFEQACKVMPGGNTRHSIFYPPYPIYIASGQGCHATDVDGVERIDCINNMSSMIHGHGNREIIEAIHQQAETLISVGAPTQAEVKLAELLCARLESVEMIRFANSGSEGIMFAVRAARTYTGRNRIAKAEGAYHGSYDVMEVSVGPAPESWGPPEAPASVPDTGGILQGVLDDVLVIPFNDVEATERLLTEHAGELAGVIIDPLVSRLGFVAATNEYLAMLRRVTRDQGIVLIFDEVFSFRLGYNGAQGKLGVTPDVTALGKVIGGGLPVGAVGGSREIMSVFDQTSGRPKVEQAGTFNANPMTMAAGYAALTQLTAPALERLNGLGERLRGGLREALGEAGLKGQVRGDGSLIAIYFEKTEVRNFRDYVCNLRGLENGMAFHRLMLNGGVMMIPPGRFILSTVMTEDIIDQIMEAARGAMRHIAASEH